MSLCEIFLRPVRIADLIISYNCEQVPTCCKYICSSFSKKSKSKRVVFVLLLEVVRTLSTETAGAAAPRLLLVDCTVGDVKVVDDTLNESSPDILLKFESSFDNASIVYEDHN